MTTNAFVLWSTQLTAKFTRELGKAEDPNTPNYVMFKDLDGNEFWVMLKY